MPAKDKPEIVEPTSAMTPQGDLVPLSGAQTMTMADFVSWLKDASEETAEPDVDPYMRILQQTLNAQTPEDVLTPIEALKAREVVGHALICEGFEFNESEFDVGSPMYASMRCVYVGILPPHELDILKIPNPSPPIQVSPGESCVVNCGHKKVITQLVQLHRLGAFPRQVVFAHRGKSKISKEPMLTLLKWGKEPVESEETGEVSDTS